MLKPRVDCDNLNCFVKKKSWHSLKISNNNNNILEKPVFQLENFFFKSNWNYHSLLTEKNIFDVKNKNGRIIALIGDDSFHMYGNDREKKKIN